MTDITPEAREMALELAANEEWDDALARLCTRFIAMQKDWAEVDRLCDGNPNNGTVHCIATIAAKYRVETDPLVEALKAIRKRGSAMTTAQVAQALRAELSKRDIAIGKAKP